MSLYKTLKVQTKLGAVNGRGHVVVAGWVDRTTLVAILANQTVSPNVDLGEVQHQVVHTIAQKGPPIALTGERLALGTRYFSITKVINPGELDKWTLYECLEREDDE